MSADDQVGRHRREIPSLWVSVGGAGLAAVAGYVNSILLSVYHVPVSHMSGAVSTMGSAVQDRDVTHVGMIVGIVLGFLSGAVLSGVIIGDAALRPGRRYGVAMVCEGVLLGLGAAVVIEQQLWGLIAFAAACGLQNGLATSYLGMNLRTTHVTGIVTDIGIVIGHRLRGRRDDSWKLRILITVFVAFIFGGIAGAYLLSWFGLPVLWLASAGVSAAGVVHMWWWRRRRIRR